MAIVCSKRSSGSRLATTRRCSLSNSFDLRHDLLLRRQRISEPNQVHDHTAWLLAVYAVHPHDGLHQSVVLRRSLPRMCGTCADLARPVSGQALAGMIHRIGSVGRANSMNGGPAVADFSDCGAAHCERK